MCRQSSEAQRAGKADGIVSGILVRRLDGRDIVGIQRHLLKLDMVSRNRRFHCGFGDAAIEAYVQSLHVTTDILFGAVEESSDSIVGLAEARRDSALQTVEIGTSVLPTHRGRGLARELVARVIAAAFAEGAIAANLMFDPTNCAAARIVARLGAKSQMPGRAVLRDRHLRPSSARADLGAAFTMQCEAATHAQLHYQAGGPNQRRALQSSAGHTA